MIVSAVTILLSTKFSFGSFANPGPGFLPLSVGIIMFLLSLILFIQSFLRREEGGRAVLVKGATARVLLILASLIVYGLLLESLGFILTTFLLMGFLLLAI